MIKENALEENVDVEFGVFVWRCAVEGRQRLQVTYPESGNEVHRRANACGQQRRGSCNPLVSFVALVESSPAIRAVSGRWSITVLFGKGAVQRSRAYGPVLAAVEVL